MVLVWVLCLKTNNINLSFDFSINHVDTNGLFKKELYFVFVNKYNLKIYGGDLEIIDYQKEIQKINNINFKNGF